jgi:catechol 2,3-dioxygenase-like lactoylglutathione lyase family enzyme
MFADTKAYSGFAVKDLQEARQFYADTLGLRTSVEHDQMWLHLAGGRDTLAYLQPDATPASYTILNFQVEDVDQAVDALAARGVRFERYDGIAQDAKDSAGRRHSPATLPQLHAGRSPRNNGMRYAADPTATEETVAVMRSAGDAAQFAGCAA